MTVAGYHNVSGHLRVVKGVYHMVIQVTDVNDTRHQYSKSTKLPEKGNKRKAQEMLAAEIDQYKAIQLAQLEQGDMLFVDYMRHWLDTVLAIKLKASTLAQYQYILENAISKYDGFQTVKMNDLSSELLQGYFNTKAANGLSGNTLRKHYCNIHKCLDYAVRKGIIKSNPADLVELPRKKPYDGAQVYTPEELTLLFQKVKGLPLEVAIHLTGEYGLRRSEACGLRWKDVDFTANTMHICHTAAMKNGKPYYSDSTKNATSNRVLPLNPEMRAYLLTVKARQEENKRLLGTGYMDSGYVCVTDNGTPVRPDYVSQRFHKLLVSEGMRVIRLHDLRHSVVYFLHKAGINVKDIQVWLGHSDPTTTLRVYSHVFSDDLSHIASTIGNTLTIA